MKSNSLIRGALLPIQFSRPVLVSICFVLMATVTSLSAQTWETFQSYQTHDYFRMALPTKDGGSIVFGDTGNGSSHSNVAVVRQDIDGNVLWLEEFEFFSDYDEIFTAIPTSDGHYLLGGYIFGVGNGSADALLIKMDENAEILWMQTYGGSGFDRIYSITEAANGDFIFCGETRSLVSGDITDPPVGMPGLYNHDGWLGRVDAQGDLLWNRRISTEDSEDFKAVVEAPDGDIVYMGDIDIALSPTDTNRNVVVTRMNSDATEERWTYHFDGDGYQEGFTLINTDDFGLAFGAISNENTNGYSDIFLTKLSGNGDLQWSRNYGGTEGEYGGYIMQLDNGNYTILGNTLSFGADFQNIYLIHTDLNGNPIWERTYYGGDNNDVPTGLSITKDNHYLIAAQQREDTPGGQIVSSNFYSLRANAEGFTTINLLEGRLTYNEGNDCFPGMAETGLEDWLVVAQSGDQKYYAASDENGHYSMEVMPGFYEVSVITPNDYWTACDDVAFFDLNTPYDTTNYNFIFTKDIICPDMEVDISTDQLNYCDVTNYHITYRNHGTQMGDNAFVQIELPTALVLSNSSIPIATQNDNVYGFAVADLAINSQNGFDIEVTHDCTNEVVGQTSQIVAQITPDEICLPIDPAWDGSSVDIRHQVEGDLLQLIVGNVGTGPILQGVTGIIIEDLIIARTEPVFLSPGQTDTLEIYPEGKTIRIEVPQSQGHPGRSRPSAAIEGVGTLPGGGISLGMVTMYPEDDANPFISIDAQQSYETFNPNALRAYPKGVGAALAIPPNTDVEYLIRFENNGTEIITNLRVQDELPQAALNVETIRPGASSHLYDYDVIEDGVIKFEFEDIALMPGQAGFVKFRVSQLPDLEDGTAFYNTVYIYDGNEVVETNRVWHEVRHPDVYKAVLMEVCEGDEVWGHTVTADVILRDTVVRETTDSITTAMVTMLPDAYEYIDTVIYEGMVFNDVFYERDTQLVYEYLSHTGCDSILTVDLSVLTSNRDITNTIAFALYPNPSSGTVVMSCHLPSATPMTVNVYRMTGEQLQSIDLGMVAAGVQAIPLPEALPEGICYVEVQTDLGVAMRKIIINK